MSGYDVSTAETNQSDQNLVYSQNKIRRLRIILGTITGLVILALLATAVYFIIAGGETDVDDTPKVDNGLNLDDVLSGQLQAKRFNGTFSSGSKILYRDDNTLYEYDTKTQVRTALLADFSKYGLPPEQSADGQYILLGKNVKKNFRHSFEAEYDILNKNTGEIKPLYINSEQRSILMIQWAPVGNGIVMNFERNLYYKPNVLGDKIVQLTYADDPRILNGIPDWVYEEEVLASNIATWFNPSGTKIAYIRFDDSPTPLINFPFYGEAGDLRYQYPYNRVVAYPKAGSSNPAVSLHTVDLKQAIDAGVDFTTDVPPPSELNTEADRLITVVTWLNDTHVLSGWMNRIQNEAYIQIMNELKRVVIYSNSSKTGWVDLYDIPHKNRDGSKIALILPTTQDDGTDYRHLCLLSTTTSAENNKPEPLTKGKFVVQSVVHWDSSTDMIFYTANTQEHSEFTHVYSIKAAKGQTPKCLTCKLQSSGGKEQTYYTAEFNTDRQVVITSQGPGIPLTKIYEWTVSNNQVTLKELIAWETNEQLSSKLSKTALPTTEILELPIANDAFKAKVLLQLPPNMDRSGKTKYPMLVDVYGGPDSYSVITKWSIDWGTYLSSNQSVIYAKIDGRGSGLRGEKILHSIYQKLGTLEIQDQIDVARQLQQKFAFIDENHTGIWGWSYGGYAAAMALANDDSFVYRCAASIAPVTDWALYDSIYTERYMGLPNINVNGYDQARLSTRAKKLRGKKFLLVHGTLDDNVHYQQAMILAKNLEREDILFKQISYPDEDHGLANVRPHLYHSLNRFFGDCFSSKRLMHSSK